MKPIQMQSRDGTHMDADAKPDQARPRNGQACLPSVKKCPGTAAQRSARNRASEGLPRTLAAPRGRDTSARSRQDDWPVCVWARAPWTAGISRPGLYLSGRVAAGLAPSTIVNPIDRLVVALRFFEFVEGWSRSGPRACREDLSGEERAWRRANSSCRVGRRGYCGFDLILAFAGPRFRAGKNFLPEILGSVFLGRNLLPVFNFGAGF